MISRPRLKCILSNYLVVTDGRGCFPDQDGGGCFLGEITKMVEVASSGLLSRVVI